MSINILAVSGKLCSGKSTLAQAIVAREPLLTRHNLADALKDRIAWICGVDRTYIDAHKAMFRPIMQYYGTDIMRAIHGDDYWVNLLVADLQGIDEQNDVYAIVDDARFPNEQEGLRNAATRFHSVRLIVTPEEQYERYLNVNGEPPTDEILTHPSETACDEYPNFDQLLGASAPTDIQVTLVLEALRRRGWFNGLEERAIEQASYSG